MSEYVVIYEQTEDGAWGAYIPDLPGVIALGASREATADLIHEALDAYTGDLHDRAQALPAPHHVADVIWA
jgi:predicted RNase H-like HicB family nuclease